ncbi:hypothetical protein RDI58_003350 [Solanum bulbocastanum]|uniref:Protein kinase domain-containing protein n=1 Tax=Solanum bulbocastanum TaxID=147425 RepID=A0AAN8UF35_SOLBU
MVMGDITKDVAVKIIGLDERVFKYTGNDKLERFEYELKLLQAPRIKGNPNLVKVIGYCQEEETLGIVYDLNPHDTLENLITRADFNWKQRVKTALTLARLLNYLHDRKYLNRNFAPYHIVLDQDFTPIMFEFGLLVGGVLGYTINESDLRCAPYGYIQKKCPAESDDEDEDFIMEHDHHVLTPEGLNQYFTSQFSFENLVAVTDLGKLYCGKMHIGSDVAVKIIYDNKNVYHYTGDDTLEIFEDFTPIMYEFGLLVGGVLRNTISASDFRLMDPSLHMVLSPIWYLVADKYPSEIVEERRYVYWSDVFAFGILLINLISTRIVVDTRDRDDAINMWVLREFKSGRSVVHQNLVGDQGFDSLNGTIITQLAIQCREDKPKKRPNMKEVIECLETLRVVQEHDKKS